MIVIIIIYHNIFLMFMKCIWWAFSRIMMLNELFLFFNEDSNEYMSYTYLQLLIPLVYSFLGLKDNVRWIAKEIETVVLSLF